MPGNHLSNDEFFTQLVGLFESRQKKGHGSVLLTQKRLTQGESSATTSSAKAADDPLWDLHPPHPVPIIIRASNGKSKERRPDKVKLSTVVQPGDLDAFYTRYAEVCKSGMQALKKRDRSKRKKDKAKKKKAGGAGTDAEKKA
ncbi:signal recognition particle 14kD protein-domain-containing protein [Lineolata rhizophorae]|uniref:Signal recognition particle subunit SRP14 n=1 Tax=Lineolata rhizophorae TaxID=578093 RepID=A0A6A6P0P8_9PEZI|nr:signal recognition particle 14kD protein-domain-containing protein [Lineolata rhizophorae]